MATKKKNNPLSKKTEWTITEFQMWLAGAYSLQGEDWVPNAEQWDMILDIIYKLKNPTAKRVVNNTPPYTPPYQQPMGNDFNNNGPVAFDASSMLGTPELPPEANMSLSELKRMREGGPSNSNVLAGNGVPGEKAIKTGTFE